jgi:thiol:disulfide interchange protein DsbC
MKFLHAARQVAVTLLFGATACLAADGPSQGRKQPHAAAQAMEAKLKSLYPTQRFDSVRVAALPGFYEVTMGKSMAYVEESGRYFLFGGLWDMQTRRDLTAERRAELEAVDVAQLPADLVLTMGSGSRTVYVFSDPNCGYCKQLEHTLSQLVDVTVRLYPVAILGDASKELVQRVWCSPNRAEAWRDWMLKGMQPPPARDGCSAPFAALQRLTEKVGVQGTPTLVKADGRKTSGAMSAAALNEWLGPTPVASRRIASPKTWVSSADASPEPAR